jgi:uncharacterized RDD family membrane protein YckC
VDRTGAATGDGAGPTPQAYPGQRLGRPQSGPGSVATFGPRLLAFILDSVMSLLVALLLFRPLEQWTVSAVFAVEVLILTAFGGASAGQRVVGMRVVRMSDGDPIAIPAAIVRTALLLLIIPAIIWDADGRGLHDKAAGTVLIRTR